MTPADTRLRRVERISRRSEIGRLMDTGERWECPLFRVVWAPGQHPFDRLAVLVSRKMGSAVARNRVKRRLREVFRTNRTSGPPYFDIAVVPRGPLTVPYRELECQYVEWRNTRART